MRSFKAECVTAECDDLIIEMYYDWEFAHHATGISVGGDGHWVELSDGQLDELIAYLSAHRDQTAKSRLIFRTSRS